MNSIALGFASLLALLSWLAPNHYPPWSAFHSEILMAAAVALAMLGALRRQPEPLPLSVLSAGSLVLALVPLAQWAGGLILLAGDAWMSATYLLGLGLVVRLGQRLASTYGAGAVLEAVAGLFVVGAIISIGFGLVQWLSLRGLGYLVADLPPNGRPFANFGQPNHLATLIFLGLVGLLYLHQRARLGGLTLGLASAYFCSGLAMTTSRTAWLAMPLLVTGMWLLRERAQLRIRKTEILALALMFVAAVLLWRPLNSWLMLSEGRAFATQVEVGPRTIFWGTALDAITRAPWLGYGWNESLVAQSTVVLDHPAGGRLMGSAHNLLLDLLLWVGVPLGALVFGGLLVWGWRHLSRARDAVSVYALAGLAGIFAHAMVELPLHYTYFLLPAGLLAGLLEARHPPRWRIRLPSVWYALPAASAAALLGTIAVEYMTVEDNMRTLRMEVARIGTGRIVSEAPRLHLLTQWEAYLRFARVEPRPGMSAQALDDAGPLVMRFPFLRAQFDHALALGLNGRPEQAALVLRQLCSLHSKLQCREKLAEWRELAASTYPQLKAVALPEPG